MSMNRNLLSLLSAAKTALNSVDTDEGTGTVTFTHAGRKVTITVEKES